MTATYRNYRILLRRVSDLKGSFCGSVQIQTLITVIAEQKDCASPDTDPKKAVIPGKIKKHVPAEAGMIFACNPLGRKILWNQG
jgi:hypothetical protein